MFKTTDRYQKISQIAKVPNLKALILYVEDRLVTGNGDRFGEFVRNIEEYIPPHLAKQCVDAIDSLPPGEDLANYMFLSRQDLMSGPSFVWDLREGPMPETGSSQTLPHISIHLAPGRDVFQQFVKQGECCDLIGNGWAGYYYSHKACQLVRKEIQNRLGSEWELYKCRNQESYQGVPQSLIVVFRSKVAPEIGIGFVIVGQGQIRWMPDILKDMQEGYQFFNVVDTDCNNRIRPGCLYPDNLTVWQYSC